VTAALVSGSPDLGFVLALAERLPDSERFDWKEPATVPDSDQLLFCPDSWNQELSSAAAITDSLFVPYAWLNAWVPLARDRGAGSVLYTASLDGVYGSGEKIYLAARDSALIAQTRSMAMELGRFGIRVNAVVLGPLVEHEYGVDEEVGQRAANPLRRKGTWADAARTAQFLLSDAAAHLTGQVLVCAGGAELGRVLA